MSYTNDQIKVISAIYKNIYKNPQGIHRNTLRKELLTNKICSKETFYKVFEGLLAFQKISTDHEIAFLGKNVSTIGILKKSGGKCYIHTPNSKKHYKVEKSAASGYGNGEYVDFIGEQSESGDCGIILGRSKKVADLQKKTSQLQDSRSSYHNQEGVILGRVVKTSFNELIFIPNQKNIEPRQIPVINIDPSYQDKICLLKLRNLQNPSIGGDVIEVKGDSGNPIQEYDAIAENYGAIMSWDNEEIKEEVKNIPKSVDTDSLSLITENQALVEGQSLGEVVDLRNLNFVTIDPATCKDMDDAIFSRYNQDGDVECYIAVANVTKYFSLNSEIGKRYIDGSFTIYAPNKAYNILPTELSTGICSLNPDEDRLAFVVKVTLDKENGEVKNSHIYDAIIRSHHKYSYEEAQEIVDQSGDLQGPVKNTITLLSKAGETLDDKEQILMDYFAAEIIKENFNRRQMLRFNSNKERDIVFDEDLDDVVDIKNAAHLKYHEVIEAFMIMANEATAKYARDNNLANVYRIHNEPNPQKVQKAHEFFRLLGINFDGELTLQRTRDLIALTQNSPSEEIANNFLIRMQSKAIYSSDLQGNNLDIINDERISHYALQSENYSHTTSPIRRVPDYITQYNILAHMYGTKPISRDRIDEIVDHINQRQDEVDQAEKDFEDISSVIYCEKHIGEMMRGKIVKFRYTYPSDELDDEILVIAKNDENGVCVEIPLSQILGRKADNCCISKEGCAVYDNKRNVVLTLCRSLDFIVEKADRSTMTISGRAAKAYEKSCNLNPQIIYSKPEKKSFIKKGTKKYRKYMERFKECIDYQSS